MAAQTPLQCGCLILAGGLGTRLREVVSEVPKVLAPVRGRPFLFFLLDELQAQGFKEVWISVGYLASVLKSKVGSQFGDLKINYIEEQEPLGTGGAIRFAANFIPHPHLAILNGDTYFPVSLSQLADQMIRRPAEIYLSLKKMDSIERYGLVELKPDLETIVSFQSRPTQPTPGIINGGVYFLNRALFLKREFKEKFSFESDYLTLLPREQLARGHIFDDEFIDIGVPEDFERCQKMAFRAPAIE